MYITTPGYTELLYTTLHCSKGSFPIEKATKLGNSSQVEMTPPPKCRIPKFRCFFDWKASLSQYWWEYICVHILVVIVCTSEQYASCSKPVHVLCASCGQASRAVALMRFGKNILVNWTRQADGNTSYWGSALPKNYSVLPITANFWRPFWIGWSGNSFVFSAKIAISNFWGKTLKSSHLQSF